MSKALLDSRRNVIQTFRKKRGSLVEFIVDGSIPQTFTPNPSLVTIYEVRTTGDIRIAAHETDYTFDPSKEPRMSAGEIDYVQIGGNVGGIDLVTVTFVGDGSAATVSFTECL